MNISHLCKSFALAGTGMSRPAGMFILFLLVLAFAPAAAFAQEVTGTWRVQVWEQDDGGPYDQFAGFCEFGSPCAAVVGVEVCVGANCQTTAGSPSTVVFTGLSLGPQTACLTDPNWLAVSGSAGAPLSGPNCVTRDFSLDSEGNHDHTTAMYVEQNVFEVTVTKAYTVAHPIADPEVDFTLTCDAGTVSTEDPGLEMEQPNGDGEPTPKGSSASKTTTSGSATFWVIGGASCYATEVVPAGYVQSASTCGTEAEPGITLPSEEPIGCTITNRPTEATFTIDKNFSDGNPVLVAAVTPLCTDAGGGPGITYTPASGNALHGTNFVTTVRYFAGATNCTATETDQVGYTQDLAQSTCDTNTVISDVADGSCVIFNQQDPITILAAKEFTGGGGTATFAGSCDAGTLTSIKTAASPGSPAEFELSNFPWNGTSCDVTEPVPPGGYYEVSSTCNDLSIVPSDDDTLCTITNAPTRATFKVTKIFADGNNVDEIEVSIDCNTGLILDQDKDLGDGEWVEFVVTSFTEGTLDCTITEDGLAGYAGEYYNVSLDVTNDESCEYTEVGGGDAYECEITNTPLDVDVDITKEWLYPGSADASAVSDEFTFVLYCTDASIVGGSKVGGFKLTESPSAVIDTCAFGGDSPVSSYDQYCKTLYGSGDETFNEQVNPYVWPGGSCYVMEINVDPAVEVDNGCGSLEVSAGSGDSCTITNTVFFEGIPTLSQYGMALLALLMLGVGFVSFRRFS